VILMERIRAICKMKNIIRFIRFNFVVFFFRESFLSKFAVPAEFCSFRDKPDCSTKIDYRTPTGVCNNLLRPYEGSSQTAFARLKSADYADCMLNNFFHFNLIFLLFRY
jgi:hypothetical protein